MSHILFDQIGHAAIITLNRPEALNALSMGMLAEMRDALAAWEEDKSVKLVIVRSSSARAFCAGGDVREAVGQIKAANGAPATQYFQVEYGIDLLFTRFSKPIICLVDGVVMGGGLGLARNAHFMVISEQIKYAMPETAIGLFPDVAANLFLRDAGLPAALMLGMTGTIIGAGDVMAWGLADYCTPAEQFEALITALTAANSSDDIRAILTGFDIGSAPPHFAGMNDVIERCFSGSLSDILAQLAAHPNQQAQIWLSAMQSKCPASVGAIHHLLSQEAPISKAEALNLDFKLALKMTARSDFVEGVRAVLIDKDNAPQWQPASLSDIDADFIDHLFDFTGLADLQDALIST